MESIYRASARASARTSARNSARTRSRAESRAGRSSGEIGAGEIGAGEIGAGEIGGAATRDLIPEQLLASLWQKRAARQQRFKTNGGGRCGCSTLGDPAAPRDRISGMPCSTWRAWGWSGAQWRSTAVSGIGTPTVTARTQITTAWCCTWRWGWMAGTPGCRAAGRFR